MLIIEKFYGTVIFVTLRQLLNESGFDQKNFSILFQMNHMREGGGAGTSSALCRISSVKSAVQVRCRACQEILSW